MEPNLLEILKCPVRNIQGKSYTMDVLKIDCLLPNVLKVVKISCLSVDLVELNVQEIKTCINVKIVWSWMFTDKTGCQFRVSVPMKSTAINCKKKKIL